MSSRPLWLFSPLRVVDSTSTGLQPFSLYTRNDTVKAWLNRSISGDRFGFTIRVRSLGRNESNIAAGLAAMSPGNDSAYAAVNVTASGQVQLGGRRQPGGSAFTSFLDAYYDSVAVWVAAVQRLHLNSSRFYVRDTLLVGQSTNPSTPVRAFVNGDVRFDGTTRLFSTDATANTLTVRGTTVQSGRLATFRTVADVGVAEIGSGGEISTWYGMTLYPSTGYANYLTIKAGNTSASYELTLPTAQGDSLSFLRNDGSGNLSTVNLIAGTNITITQNADSVVFAATSSGSGTDTVWLPVWTSAHDTLVDASTAKPILYGANTDRTKIYAYFYKHSTMSRLRFWATESKTGGDTTRVKLYVDDVLEFTRIITGSGSSFVSEIDISSYSNNASHEIRVDFSNSGGNTYKLYNAGIELAKAVNTAAGAVDSVYRPLYSLTSDTTGGWENTATRTLRQLGGDQSGNWVTKVRFFYTRQSGDSAVVAKFLFSTDGTDVATDSRARLNIGSAPTVTKTSAVTDTFVTLRATLSGVTADSSLTVTFDLFSELGEDTVTVKNLTIYAVKYVSVVSTAGGGSALDSTAVDTLSVMFVPATSGIIATSSTTTLWATDTTMRVVMFEMPHAFRVDTVYHRQLAASANDTIVYALFDRDGNQKWRTVVQLTTGGTTNTYAMAVVTPVLVPAGTYYWAWMQSGGYNPSSQMTFTDAQMDALVSMNTLSGYGLPAHSGEAANKWSPSANTVPSTLGTITRRATTDNWVPPVAIMVGAK